jgi:RHS repeat-associated protein
MGNRLSQDSLVGLSYSSIDYTYDIANRLTAVDEVEYTWDDNGNLLDDGVNTYAYDSANRLVSISGGASAVDYVYNGLGDRLQQTVGSTTTTYTLDLNGGLTQVLSDGANTYLYGNSRIAQENTTTEYFLADALGSVRQLADESGAVTYAVSYSPYGEILSSAGDGETIFGFAGEQTDQTGMVYLRARYYNPYLNQFIQRDTIVPNPRIPADWNKYTYTRDNPVNYTDPTGKSSCYNHLPASCLTALQLLQGYANVIKQGVKYGDLPVEGFARFVDFSQFVFQGDIRDMMWGITLVLNDFDANKGLVSLQVLQGEARSPYYIHNDWLPYRNNPLYDDPNWGGGEYGIWIHSLRGDWKAEYWDKTANQAYHFWFYAAVAFFDGRGLAEIGNLIHDNPGQWEDYDYLSSPENEAPPSSGISKPDYDLAFQGMDLGDQLRYDYNLMEEFNFWGCDAKKVHPEWKWTEPGNWIRDHLKQ